MMRPWTSALTPCTSCGPPTGSRERSRRSRCSIPRWSSSPTTAASIAATMACAASSPSSRSAASASWPRPYTFEPHDPDLLVIGHRRIQSDEGLRGDYLFFVHSFREGRVARIAAYTSTRGRAGRHHRRARRLAAILADVAELTNISLSRGAPSLDIIAVDELRAAAQRRLRARPGRRLRLRHLGGLSAPARVAVQEARGRRPSGCSPPTARCRPTPSCSRSWSSPATSSSSRRPPTTARCCR